MFPDDLSGDNYTAHWNRLNHGETLNGEFRRKRRDGSEMWIAASYTPILDSDGNPYKVIKYANDITERVKAVDIIGTALNRIAQGTLNQPIDQQFAPEFESLRSDCNLAQANLSHALLEVQGSAGQIRVSSETLARSSQESATRTESQALSLEETTNSIVTMVDLVRGLSQDATDTKTVVEQAKSRAEAGNNIMAQARNAMNAITESSAQIASITSVIDQIAFQTNLLALSAGVESARG